MYADSKFETLRQTTEGRVFTVSDAAQALAAKKSSVYWVLSNLVRDQRLIRVARGYYAFAPERGQEPEPSLSYIAQEVVRILAGEGIRFYVTGLDILAPYFDQIPASYPPLVYVEKGSSDWAMRALSCLESPTIVNPKRREILIARTVHPSSDPIILRETAEFSFVSGSLASVEKAFVDTYYEITRDHYDFPLGDLAHVIVNCFFRGRLNPVRVVGAARRRRIDAEVRYLLDYGFGIFHERARPTLQLSRQVQDFIRTVRQLRNQAEHGQNR